MNYQAEVDRLLRLVPPEHYGAFLGVILRGEGTAELSKAATAHPQLLQAVSQWHELLRNV